MAEPRARTGTTTFGFLPRSIEAPTGSRFMDDVRALYGDTHGLSAQEVERRKARFEEMVYAELRRGNVPDFMRPENFREITVERTIGGRTVQARLRVCPDYLAIGSNDDYVRVPLSPVMAQRIAQEFGLALPTQRVVDIIDDEARRTRSYLPFHAAPQLAEHVTNPRTSRPVIEGEAGQRWNFQQYGFYEGRWMLSPEFVSEQSREIDGSFSRAGRPSGIRSGHKKDVIYDLLAIPTPAKGPRVVIYHRGIQGLSDIHEVTYFDYSHGIRYLDGNVRLTITEQDGTRSERTMTVAEILRDRQLCQLLSPATMDISRMYQESRAGTVPRRTQPQPPSGEAQRRQPQPVQ